MDIITFKVSETKTDMEIKQLVNGDTEYMFFMSQETLNDILEKHFDAKQKIKKLKNII